MNGFLIGIRVFQLRSSSLAHTLLSEIFFSQSQNRAIPRDPSCFPLSLVSDAEEVLKTESLVSSMLMADELLKVPHFPRFR